MSRVVALAAERRPGRLSRVPGARPAAVVASIAVGVLVAGLPIRDAGPVALALAIAISVGAALAGRQRILLALGAAAYVGAIHVVYVGWVVPVYAYSGLVDSGVDPPSIAAVSILAVLPALWLPIQLRRPSDAVLWPLYLFGYVPAAVIPIYILGPDLSAVLPFALLLAVGFGVVGVLQLMPRAALKWSGLDSALFHRVLVALGLVGITYLLVVFPPSFPPPALESVYETRAQYAAAANASPGAGYLVIWLGNVVFPFLVALGFARARPLLLGLGLGGQILVYTITGLKTILFSIIFLPLLFLAVRHAGRSFGTAWTWASLVLIALSTGATVALGSIWPLALFVTRLIAVPGQLTAYYYDFFSSNAAYLLSHSVLRWFVPGRYDVEPPFLIGRIYLHTTIDANANVWADAVANFGLIGIVPISVLLGLLLWLLDSASSGRDLRVIAPVVGLAGFYLANGALLTQVLTGGIALILGIIVLMPSIRVDAGSSGTGAGL